MSLKIHYLGTVLTIIEKENISLETCACDDFYSQKTTISMLSDAHEKKYQMFGFRSVGFSSDVKLSI